jgi:hypothetical protein
MNSSLNCVFILHMSGATVRQSDDEHRLHRLPGYYYWQWSALLVTPKGEIIYCIEEEQPNQKLPERRGINVCNAPKKNKQNTFELTTVSYVNSFNTIYIQEQCIHFHTLEKV